MRLLWTLGVCVVLLHMCRSLLLGAFNIKSFGDKKASNNTLMDIISTIIHRYDIILIQEVRDNDLSATKKLMEHVNKDSEVFSYITSEPLGRSSYKERYLFLYRPEMVTVSKNYTYDDGCEPCGNDSFIREPFIVMFTSRIPGIKNVTLIPQHTSPDAAVEELKALYDVVTDVRHRWRTNDLVVLGDFNAGCRYVTDSEFEQILLYTDKSFHWLISSDVDTTVTNTHCAYDRIVVTEDMMKSVNHSSVYNYMMDLNLSLDLALAVSDHYPVEVRINDPVEVRINDPVEVRIKSHRIKSH